MASASSVSGGGRSVHMEMPLERAVRNASLYTKVSYFLLFFCFFSVFAGIRSLMITGAVTIIKCDNQHLYCSLSMKRRGRRGKTKVKIHRDQLVRTNFVEINESGEITSFVTADGEPNPERVAGSRRGSDPFPSYTLVLRPYERRMSLGESESAGENKVGAEPRDLVGNLETLGLTPNQNGEHQIIMRQYESSKNRRKTARAQHNRLKQYIDKRRNSVSIRERVSASWKGVLMLVFGMFGAMFTAVGGQFWEEDKRSFVSRRGGRSHGQRRQGGPGSRSSYGRTDGTSMSGFRRAEIRGTNSTAMKRK